MAAQQALPRIVGALLDRVDAIAEGAVDETMRQEDSYRGLVPPEDLREAARDTIELTLCRLGDRPPRPQLLQVEQILGERRAEQGVPLEAFIRTFHRDFHVLWDALRAEADGDDEDDRAALLSSAGMLWEAVELSSSRSVEAYRHAESRMARRNESQRQMLLEALFEGKGPSASAPTEAAQALGVPEHDCFIVAALDDRRGQISGAAQAETALANTGHRSVWRSRADCSLGLILAGELTPADVSAILSSLPLRGGLSYRFEWVRDAPLASMLAGLALRTVPAQASSVALLDERLPEALVSTHPELAERIVEVTLGPLLELGESERARLLETVRAFIDSDSVEETAARLFCHRNTVLYRIRQWEELTGRSPRSLGYAAELRLALHAHGRVASGTRAATVQGNGRLSAA
jgi:PucR C-terminal helix-turn-helix domain